MLLMAISHFVGVHLTLVELFEKEKINKEKIDVVEYLSILSQQTESGLNLCCLSLLDLLGLVLKWKG